MRTCSRSLIALSTLNPSGTECPLSLKCGMSSLTRPSRSGAPPVILSIRAAGRRSQAPRPRRVRGRAKRLRQRQRESGGGIGESWLQRQSQQKSDYVLNLLRREYGFSAMAFGDVIDP